jgi:hypothetical protein
MFTVKMPNEFKGTKFRKKSNGLSRLLYPGLTNNLQRFFVIKIFLKNALCVYGEYANR